MNPVTASQRSFHLQEPQQIDRDFISKGKDSYKSGKIDEESKYKLLS
jgi:hypothetical protein